MNRNPVRPAFASPPQPAKAPPAPTTRPAPRVKVLPPSAFAEGWAGRPLGPVRMGIRLVGEDVIQRAQVSARSDARLAVSHLDWPLSEGEQQMYTDVFNTALMLEVLVVALCKADDVTQAWFTVVPNDMIRVALPPATIKALWEEYELLVIETSPVRAEASAEDVATLGDALVVALGKEPSVARQRVLRLARALLEDASALVE